MLLFEEGVVVGQLFIGLFCRFVKRFLGRKAVIQYTAIGFDNQSADGRERTSAATEDCVVDVAVDHGVRGSKLVNGCNEVGVLVPERDQFGCVRDIGANGEVT